MNKMAFQRLLDELNAVSNTLFVTETFLVQMDEFTDHLEDLGPSGTDLHQSLMRSRQIVMIFVETLAQMKQHLQNRMMQMILPTTDNAEEVN